MSGQLQLTCQHRLQWRVYRGQAEIGIKAAVSPDDEVLQETDDSCLSDDKLLWASNRHQLLLGAVELTKALTTDTMLLDVMKFHGTLSDSDYQRINTEPVNFKRNLLLIDVLLRGTYDTFCSFSAAAKQTGQKQLLRQAFSQARHDKVIVPYSQLRLAFDLLQTHGDMFLRCVDPNGCLVLDFAAQLRQRDSELDELTRKKLMSPVLTNCDKNFILLQWLRSQPLNCLEAFLQAANSNKQQHVVNMLLANTENVYDQPLSEAMRKRLTRIMPLLADVLDFDSKAFRGLLQKKVLSWTQYETLIAERREYDRNVKLIDVLQHGSLCSLLHTTEALADANMALLGKYLLKGEMPILHANINCSNNVEDTIFGKLIKYIRRIGDKETATKLDSLLADVSLVAVCKVNSLLLYFFCESVSKMDTLTQLLESGRLEWIIEAVFHTLTVTTTGLNVSLQLHDQQQFDDCYRFLHATEKKICVYDRVFPLIETEVTYLMSGLRKHAKPLNSTVQAHVRIDGQIQCLPYELHEMLLMSSARELAKTRLKTDSRPDVETFVTLASVCRHFHTILLKRRWFTWTLKKYLTVVSRPYRLCPPLLMTIAGQRRLVLGLNKLDNKLYVVYSDSDTIDVFTTQSSYTQRRSIHVNGLKAPQNIATCSINSCLYVADGGSGSHCVWKVTGDYEVGKWVDVQNVARLSVTSDGRVVMLIAIDLERVSDKVQLHRGRVDVYSAARVKLTIVKLPRDIVNPHHVIQTVNKSFIVSHGDRNTELNRICEVNNAGVLVKSYGESHGSGLGQLSGPAHIALDKDERVFVVDVYNRRVLLLDKQLNIQRVLLTWSRDLPGRVFYDRETSQLIVGLSSGQLEIYSLL